mmetsp:Transcript_3544/g.6166  ORF Transcript_3544/g.6166 Transcript_3544/m.6166 type:complete len:204 (-) Transcript_3544:666-1277(-)
MWMYLLLPLALVIAPPRPDVLPRMASFQPPGSWWCATHRASSSRNVQFLDMPWLGNAQLHVILNWAFAPDPPPALVIPDFQLLSILRAPQALATVFGNPPPLGVVTLLTSGGGHRGVHFVFISSVDVLGQSLVIHDGAQQGSRVGQAFREGLRRAGWEYRWIYHGTQVDCNDICIIHAAYVRRCLSLRRSDHSLRRVVYRTGP